MIGVIGHKSIKTFVRALKFLAKYSSEYVLEAKEKQFNIKTCSTSQISLATVSFDELFFVNYEHSGSREESICRVSAKVILNILRTPKAIASITIKFDLSRDCIFVNIHKHNDFVVKNKVSLLEFDEFDDYTLPKEYSEILCQPSVFRRVLQSSSGIDELFFDFKKESVTIQSYIDYPDEDCENIRLNYSIDISEFLSYDLKAENAVIASCEDFVILLNLAETMDMEILMQFSKPGRPMISILRGEGTYTTTLVQATLPPKVLKRNISNSSYKQVVTEYVEKRKEVIEPENDTNTLNNTGITRAVNPNITFTTSNERNKSLGLLLAANKPNETKKLDETKKDRSSQQTYISTPSEVRGNSKRKSTDESMLVDEDAGNVTKDNVMEKRRRTALNSTVANTTVVGTNKSIVLSQKEINEVNDIMSEIYQIPLDDDENDIMLPATQQNEQLIHQTESHDVEMRDIQDSEQSNLNEDLFTHDRLPLNSYFRDSEDLEKENLSAAGNNPKSSRSKGVLDSLFGHIFKPRSKTQYGRVLVAGSDSESEDVV